MATVEATEKDTDFEGLENYDIFRRGLERGRLAANSLMQRELFNINCIYMAAYLGSSNSLEANANEVSEIVRTKIPGLVIQNKYEYTGYVVGAMEQLAYLEGREYAIRTSRQNVRVVRRVHRNPLHEATPEEKSIMQRVIRDSLRGGDRTLRYYFLNGVASVDRR